MVRLSARLMLLAYRTPSPLAGLTELPSRLLVAKWGQNKSVKGDFTVNEKTARFLPVMQKLLGFDTVALDFEHNTVPGTPAFEADKEPRNVAAHGAPEVVAGEGLYLRDLKWTPHGEKSVREGLHPDLSPTIKTDESGAIVFVHSAALCRQGAVADLQVFSAALSPEKLAAFSAAIAGPISSQPKINAMDFKKLLILLLGLDANAADTDIEAACKKFASTRDAVAGASTKLESFSASFKTLTDRITALEQSASKSAIDGLVADAIRQGKLVPNSITTLSFEQAKKILEELPAGIVPVDQRTPDGLKSHSASLLATGNPLENEVARQMGVKPESLKKHGDARHA
jgi:phage I-like protein